jgi:poly(3-hydroxybutyrate) depolymerase
MLTRSLSEATGFLVLGIVAALGCGGATQGDGDPSVMPSKAGSASAGGSDPVNPSGAVSGVGGPAESPSAGSDTGGTPDGGTPGGGAPGGGADPGGGAGGASGGSGGAAGRDVRAVWKSDGCGKAYDGPSGNVPITLNTLGEKDLNCADKLNGQPRCGLWGQPGSTWQTDPVPRDHYIYLPESYDANVAYSLVLLGPGCGGNGTNIYPYDNNVGGTAIRVGVTPPPNYVGHATNPNQGCFDDKEGDDSVDWVEFEMMYDQLNAQLCFDRNRVFAGGNSTGAWWSNELGCKYAGDATRPIRGVIPNTGGLPTDPAYVPTCTKAPMAGLWIHEVNDPTGAVSAGNKVAIARAMSVNSCTIGTNYDNAMFEDFPIGGAQPANTCKRILGCDALYPLVVCPLPGNGHGSHDNVVNPGASTFIKLFSQGAFITP